MLPRLIYSPGYDTKAFPGQKRQRFGSRKYSRAYAELESFLGDVLSRRTVLVEHEINAELLQLVHTPEYLAQLEDPRYLARALEVPFLADLPLELIEEHVLCAVRLVTQGSVLAAHFALEEGAAINLAGGYHHASADRGEGFCLFADIAIAIADLRAQGRLHSDERVLIVDLDVHQGNGLERIFRDDGRISFVDVYNHSIYPRDKTAQVRIDYAAPLEPGTGDAEYLAVVREIVPRALAEVKPSLAFYNAGTDVYYADALGGLALSFEGVLERDRLVFEAFERAGVPWAMMLSGGYSQDSYKLIAHSVQRLFEV